MNKVMFKRQKIKYKSQSGLTESVNRELISNFKSGSIELSTEEILLIKLDKLNELVSIPLPDQQFRIVTQKAVNSFDFILAILANENIEEMIIAFYRIGKKVIQEMKTLQKTGKIKSIYFLLNDGAPKLIPDAYNLLVQYSNKNWTVKVENNHTKIICIRTKQNYYVIEGSGNLSINARIEQYVFDNNKKLFNFHKNWITKL